MKRPTKEEFMEVYANTNINLAKYWGVNQSTIWRWKQLYVHELTSDVSEDWDKKTKQPIEYYYGKAKDAQKNLTIYREVNISLNRDVLLVGMSDIHIGSKFVDYDLLMEDIKFIRDTPGVYVLIVGDLLDSGPEGTSPPDLKHDQILSYKESREYMKLIFDEIGHKVIAMTSGCHGAWSYKMNGFFFEEELNDKTLTKAFIQHGGVLNLKLGEENYRIFMSHKIRGHSKLNPTRGIFRTHEMGLDFDIGIGAHRHVPNISVLTRRSEPIYAILLGAYKSLDYYANKQGFTGNKMSIPGIYLSNKSKLIVPLYDWRQGLELIANKIDKD